MYMTTEFPVLLVFIPSWSSVHLLEIFLLQSEQLFLVFLVVKFCQRPTVSVFLGIKCLYFTFIFEHYFSLCIDFVGESLFLFNHFKDIIHCLPAATLSIEKSAVSLVITSLKVISFHFFNIFFQKFNYHVPMDFFFIFILIVVL